MVAGAVLGSAVLELAADFERLEHDMMAAERLTEGSLANMSQAALGLGTTLSMSVTAPIVAIGGAAVLAGQEYESAVIQMQRATGAFGDDLAGLEDDLQAIVRQVPESMGEVSVIVGELNTRLDLTGDALQSVGTRTADFLRVNNLTTDSVSTLGRFVNALDLELDEVSETMDKLTIASQMSGIGVDRLMGLVIEAGPAFQELGFDLDRSVALFAQFEKVGARPEEVISSLGRALSKLASEGFTDAEAAFNEYITRIEEAPDILSATLIANELFGARVGGKVAEDIRDGRFEVEEWVDALQEAEGAVDNMAEETLSASDKFSILKNQISLALVPVGLELMGLLTRIIDPISRVVNGFSNMSDGVRRIIMIVAALAASIGPALVMFGRFATVIGAAVSPIGAVIAGIALLAIAFHQNLFGLRTLVERVFGVVIDVVGNVEDAIESFKQAFSGDWVDAEGIMPLHRIFGTLGTVIREVIQAVESGDFVGVLRALSRGLQNLGGIARELVQNLFAGVLGILKELDWTEIGLSIISLIGQGLSMAGHALVNIAQLAGTILTSFINIVTSIDWGEVARTAFGFLWEAIQTFFGGVQGAEGAEGFMSIFEELGSIVRTFAEGVVSSLLDVGSSILDFGGELISWIVGVVSGIEWDDVWEAISTGLAAAASAISFVATEAAGIAVAIVEWIVEQVSGIEWSDVWDTVSAGLSLAASAISFVGSEAAGLASSVGGWISDQLDGVTWETIGEKLREGFNFSIDMLSALADYAVEIANSVLGWLVEQIGGVDWEAVGDAIIEGFVDAVELIATGAGMFVDLMTGWFEEDAKNIDLDTTMETLHGLFESATSGFSDFGAAAAESFGPLQGIFSWFDGTLFPAIDTIFMLFTSLLIPTFEAWRDSLVNTGDVISSQVGPLFDDLRGLIEVLSPVFDILRDSIEPVSNIIKDHLLPQLKMVALPFVAIGIAVEAAAIFFAELLPHAISATIAIIRMGIIVFTQMVDAIITAVRVVVALFRGDWREAWDIAWGFVERTIERIQSFLDAHKTWIVSLFTGIVNGIIGLFTRLYNRIVGRSLIPDLVDGIVEWISELPGKVLGFFRGMIDDVIDAVSEFVDDMIQKGKDVIDGFIDGLIGKAGDLISAVDGIVSDFLSGFGDLKDRLFEIGGDAISGLIDGVKGAPGALVGAGIEAGGSVISGITSLGRSPWPATIEAGLDAARGLIVGLEKGEQEVLEKAISLGQGVVSMINSALDLSERLSSMPAIATFSESMQEQLGHLLDGAVSVVSSFNDRWDNDVIERVNEIASKITSMFGPINAALELSNKLQDESFSGLADFTEDMRWRFVHLIDQVLTILDWVNDHWSLDVMARIKAVAGLLSGIFDPINDALGLMERLQDTTFDDYQEWTDTLRWRFVALINGIAQVLDWFVDNWDEEILENIKYIARLLSGITTPLIDALSVIEHEGFEAIGEGDVWSETLRWRFVQLINGAVQVFDWFVDHWDIEVLEAINEAASKLRGIFGPFSDALQFVDRIQDTELEDFEAWTDDLRDRLVDVMHSVTTAMNDFSNQWDIEVLESVDEAASKLRGLFGPLSEAVKFVETIQSVTLGDFDRWTDNFRRSLMNVTVDIVALLRDIRSDWDTEVLEESQETAGALRGLFSPFEETLSFVERLTDVNELRFENWTENLRDSMFAVLSGVIELFTDLRELFGGELIEEVGELAAPLRALFDPLWQALGFLEEAGIGRLRVTDRWKEQFRNNLLDFFTSLVELFSELKDNIGTDLINEIDEFAAVVESVVARIANILENVEDIQVSGRQLGVSSSGGGVLRQILGDGALGGIELTGSNVQVEVDLRPEITVQIGSEEFEAEIVRIQNNWFEGWRG